MSYKFRGGGQEGGLQMSNGCVSNASSLPNTHSHTHIAPPPIFRPFLPELLRTWLHLHHPLSTHLPLYLGAGEEGSRWIHFQVFSGGAVPRRAPVRTSLQHGRSVMELLKSLNANCV